MTPAFLPTTAEGRRWRLVEECGEVAQALGKVGRFGLTGRDPRTGIGNARALLAEIQDLKHALDAVEDDLVLMLSGPEAQR